MTGSREGITVEHEFPQENGIIADISTDEVCFILPSGQSAVLAILTLYRNLLLGLHSLAQENRDLLWLIDCCRQK